MKINDPAAAAVLDKCICFLESIGIRTQFGTISTGSFLPGLLIENGHIIIDRDTLLYPGDLLHEAGHIAVVPADERSSLNDTTISERQNRESEEMMAIAWSYAACIHLQLDPYIVFHDDGYKGGGKNIVENFQTGHLFGTPMLQWCGMTIEPKHGQSNERTFPGMIKWIRD